MLRNLKLSLAALTLACMGSAHAFDNVTGFNTLYKGEIKSVQALPNGIEVIYARGNRVRLFNVNNPKNGSPVDYKFITYDAHLQAYVIDVWRVGKQTVLLSKRTGAAAEVGNVRKPSPNKQVIFSSDCLETGCYYQLTQWPSGKRLAFSQALSTSGHYAQSILRKLLNSRPLNGQAIPKLRLKCRANLLDQRFTLRLQSSSPKVVSGTCSPPALVSKCRY